MSQPDPIVQQEIHVIRKIVQDETWYESERRGCQVSADDPVVRENVCRVIFRIGAQLREALRAQIAAE
jgi:hypothetical protein